MSITIKDPLLYKSELIFGPYEGISFSDRTRIIIHSDISISVIIYWSVSKFEMKQGTQQKIQCPPGFYRSEEFLILYPFFWIVVRKSNVQEENTKLHLQVYDPNFKKQPQQPEKKLNDGLTDIQLPEKLHKGVFFKKDKKITFSSKDSSRLPEFIPKDNLICGSFNNKLKTLPPPEEESVLTYKNGSYDWILISALKNKI